MPLTKEESREFHTNVTRFLKQERQGTTAQIWEYINASNRKLVRRIKKESKKLGPTTYIGRYLMRGLVNEGWVKHNGKVWTVLPVDGRCTNCFCLVEVIYVLDTNQHQYCDVDCMDELEAGFLEDGYLDDYLSLFEDFKSLYPTCESYLRAGKLPQSAMDHIELCSFIKNLDEWLEYSEYAHIYLNGGDDGALAAELYRMLTTLEKCLEELEKLEREIKEIRGPQVTHYGLFISQKEINKKSKNRTYQSFIKNNQYHFICSSQIWITEDLFLRNKWVEKLSKSFKTIDYVNLLKCPECGEVKKEKEFERPAADTFSYCRNCYEERV